MFLHVSKPEPALLQDPFAIDQNNDIIKSKSPKNIIQQVQDKRKLKETREKNV